MLSPSPHKAAPPTSPSPYTPNKDDAENLNAGRSFWYDTVDEDEATYDLREALSCKEPKLLMLPDWMPAFEPRSLSEASTCATSPQPPSSQFTPKGVSPPSSPDRALLQGADLDECIESPIDHKQPQCPPGALDKSSWLQARKVFVGGIPQTVDQNGLYNIFSKIGKVKKAWLQLFHHDRSAGQAPGVRKHRGFGFVIFYEKQSIDKLLGNSSSRFVCFSDEIELEVKRAVGKKCGDPSGDLLSKKLEKDSLAESQSSSQAWASICTTSFSGSQSSPHEAASHDAPSFQKSVQPGPCGSVSPPSQTWCSGSSAVSPVLQPVLLGVHTCTFPCVPPFPSASQWPAANSPCMRPLTSSPLTSSPPQSQSFLQAGQLLSNVLLDGFIGPKPVNAEELKLALLEAMPDHYDE